MNSPSVPYTGLFGAVNYPGFIVNNFSSKMILATFFAHLLVERFVFAQFEEQLSSRNPLASSFLQAIRAFILILTAFVWYFKPEEGKQKSRYLTEWIASSIVPIEGISVVLVAFTYSAVVFYDVLVVNPQLVGLSRHAVLACYGSQVVAPLIFFVTRDTPADAIFLSWGISVATVLVCSLYAGDIEQLVALFLYVYLSSVMFVDTMERNKKMCDIVATLQHTLKENERLAAEAQAVELRAMIGNVAHDLKTPLTSFLSGIECISDILEEWRVFLASPAFVDGTFVWTQAHTEMARGNNVMMRNCVANMNSTNSFMTMTINRCLDYTKSSKGFKLVPKFETVGLQAALEMPVKLITDANADVQIRVMPLADTISSHIITDKQWLLENLLCLLSNAAKYSHKGLIDVSVTSLSVGPHSPRASADITQFLRFEVQDTGIGLSDEAMQGLFNPFKQAQRLAGGTGLGLFSLAKRVEALHGQYGVMRRPDGEQGSVFWFTIPYRPDKMTADSLKPRLCTTLSVNTDNEGETITASLMSPNSLFDVLVVDDAPLIVKMTTMLLQRKGHRVQHAVNGADALEKLNVCIGSSSPETVRKTDKPHTSLGHHRLFDVVLMDLQMPVMDGIEAIRRLRAAEKRSEPTHGGNRWQFVIALSANSDDETRCEALAAGANVFMCKPFTYDGFVALMVDRDTRYRSHGGSIL